MKNLFKKLWRRYEAPTPKFWRALGNALVWVFGLTTVHEMVNKDWYFMVIYLLAGFLGHLLTNLHTEKKDN